MNYGNIKKFDIANGEGVRVTLFVSGCSHHCKNCFNPETWNFNYGKPFTKEVEEEILLLLEDNNIHGLTLLGGEPFEMVNQHGWINLARRVKEKFPHKTIWAYSGYTFEQLTGNSAPHCEITNELLSYVDVLVDGKFIEELKNLKLNFRGSSNQRIIDLKKTREQNQIVLHSLNN